MKSSDRWPEAVEQKTMVAPTPEKESVLAKDRVIEDEGSLVQNKQEFDPASLNSVSGRAKQLHRSPSVYPTNTPGKLVNLCLGVLGQHFEEIAGHLADISVILPRNIKMSMVAIARRRKLLDDGILIALLDDSWVNLDISGSDVSDIGLSKAVQACPNLHAIDIRKCKRITIGGVSALISQCHSLEILRWGGCPSSESTARKCLSMLVPKLNAVEEDSWENLDNAHLVDGAQSLRWLVWPNIDSDSRARLGGECPRIVVNPQPSPIFCHRFQIPPGASADAALDEPYVAGIDPKTWTNCASSMHASGVSVTIKREYRSPLEAEACRQAQELREMSVAEKFRLAFVERDQRLAPKRAKNLRQHQRRAEKEWASSSSEGKSIVLASKFRMSLKH